MSSETSSIDRTVENEGLTQGSSFYRRMAGLLALLFLAGVVLVCYYQLFGTANWLTLEEDDFFYYLKAAANFAHGRGSTFGGIPTNGYHPLWFLLLAAVTYLPNTGSEIPMRIFLALAIFASTTATYFLSRRLLLDGVSNPLLVNALAIISALYAMRLYCSGMEVILTIPLIFLLAVVMQSQTLWVKASFWKSAGLGLLVSAIFLSRLDSVLLLCLLAVAGVLCYSRFDLALRPVWVVLGLTPILLYLLLNHIYFHSWLPVSGSAKQLKTTHMPSWPAWGSTSHANALCMGVVLFGVFLLPMVYRRLTSVQKALYPILLLFPFLHLFVISCLSDWRVWPWYFYGLRPALCVSFSVFLRWQPAGALLRRPLVTAAVALVSLPMFALARREGGAHGFYWTYVVATDVRQFAATHPGTYAMGDRAGIVSFLLPDPLVQTEGLMADGKFLALIRKSDPLRDALAQYRVDYYIASSKQSFTGCFHAIEPAQAGPASPHMVADFCSKPVADYLVGGEHTFLFDLREK